MFRQFGNDALTAVVVPWYSVINYSTNHSPLVTDLFEPAASHSHCRTECAAVTDCGVDTCTGQEKVLFALTCATSVASGLPHAWYLATTPYYRPLAIVTTLPMVPGTGLYCTGCTLSLQNPS